MGSLQNVELSFEQLKCGCLASYWTFSQTLGHCSCDFTSGNEQVGIGNLGVYRWPLASLSPR